MLFIAQAQDTAMREWCAERDWSWPVFWTQIRGQTIVDNSIKIT
jgi:hypothetical protein